MLKDEIVQSSVESVYAEEELRKSGDKFQTLINLMPDPVVIVDAKGKFLAVNDRVEEKTGFKREELLGKNFLRIKIVTVKSKAILLKNLAKRMMGMHVVPYEVEVFTKDGGKLPFEVNASKIEYEGKQADLVIFRDITQRKKAEESLKQAEEKHRTLLATANVMVQSVNAEGRFLYVNKEWKKILGYTDKDLEKITLMDVIRKDHHKYCMDVFKQVMKGKSVSNVETVFVAKDGKEIIVRGNARPMLKDGEFASTVGFFFDITTRKKAEEELRFLKEFNERIVNSINDTLLVVDPSDYTVISTNEAALKQLKLRKEDLIGKTCYETTHHRSTPCRPPHDVCPIQEMLKTGKAVTVEHTHFDKDNNEIYVEVSASPVRNQEGNIVQVVHLSKDITERRKVEEERNKLLRDYGERIKELHCLYGMAKLVEKPGVSLEEILQGTANLLPPAWQYPDVACARIFLEGREFKTKNFRETPWKQQADIKMHEKRVGTVEVYYSEEKPTIDEGPFPKEERDLIDAVAERLGRITERKKTEKVLQESEEKFKTLAEQSPNMIFVNKKGRVVYANRKCEEITGYKREEFYSSDFDFLTLIDLQFKDLIKASFSRHMKGEGVAPYEFILVTKEGKRIDVMITTNLIRYDGESAILGILTDITKRKRAEEKIMKTSEEWKKTFDAISDLVYILDKDFKILKVNKTTCDILKKEPEELIGKRCFKVIHGTDKPWTNCPNYKTLLTKKATTAEINDPNLGLPLSVTASPIFDDKGELIGSVHIAKDITKRKKTEKRIRESEEKFRNIFDSANDGMIYLNRSGRILDVNKKAVQVFGGSKKELLGKHFTRVGIFSLRETPKLMTNFANILAGKKVTVNINIKNKKGREIPLECSASLTKINDKFAGVMVIVRDVTERKKMEGKLKEYSEHLEEKVEERTRDLKKTQERLIKSERLAAIGELATMVGHDLRNPLQSIENATYYLNNELSRLPPSIPIPKKATEMLQIINDSVNYADKIIRDLQDFSAQKKPILKKTDINAIVMEALSQVEVPENVGLITELDRLPEIKVDKDMMKRVFLNLAINGIQAMENGGMLKVSTKKTKKFVQVSFEDTGIGMSKENMKKLFTPFFTTKAKGMGMGLPICKRFVDAHDGSIKVESVKRKGTTFTVKLPIQPRQMEVKTIVEK